MSSSSTKVNVLHIDDEEDILFYSKTLLEEFEPQLNVTNVHTPTELFTELDTGKYDLVLSDYRMPELNGIELGEQVKTRYKVPFILYTGQGSEEVAEKAFGVGIDDYLRKENEPAHYQVLAKRIMYAVEMTRTQVEVKRHERQLTALHEHSWQLGMASSVEIVNEITLNILRQVGLTFATFQIVTGANLWATGLLGCKMEQKFIPINGAGVTSRVARTGKSALIPDTRGDPDFVATSTPTLSELAVPVMSDGVVYAVLNVESEKLNAFTENDLQLMELLGSHVASAMNRLRATEEERTQRKKYEQRLTALHAHSLELNNAQTISDISESTFQIMTKILEYPHVSFHLLEDDVLRTQSISDQAKTKLRLPLSGKGITTRAARTGQTILLGDTRLDPDYVKGTFDTLSELAVPAINQEVVYGVLNTESEKLNAFTENDHQLMEVLA
ncbi:MAG: GAF domain-containing protein, partial [Candidatus Bathyarchaeota archaeon]|nr:GAF domain-containing protein [Candidatus Bathyarchaeota archaeon]